VLTEYDKRTNEGLRGQQHSLFDIWSPRSACKERIPFDFTNAPTLFEDSPERGLDFAVVMLPNTVLQMLSQAIKPFTHETWIHRTNINFDFYAILGIPAVDATQETASDGRRHTVTTFPNSRVIWVDDCSNSPGNTQQTEFPQFVGQIRPGDTISDITGTSGGPMLGFRKDPEGKLRSWPVAIQSRWRPRSRIVIGTSVPIVARGVQDWIAQFASDSDESPIEQSVEVDVDGRHY
jgi:hypothetical protein